MRTVATAKIKISPCREIYDTVNAYRRALQHCTDVAWNEGISNNIELHKFVYYDIREKFKLPAQLAIACIKHAAGMMKRTKTKLIIKRGSVRYNFPRSANIKGNILVLRLLDSRKEYTFNIPDCYKEYFSWKVCESLLRVDKKGRCFFLFTFSKEVDAIKSNSSQNRVLGIDLGVNNLAVCSDSRFYKSNKVKQIKRKYRYLRTKLQSKGTRSAKRLLKKMSGRETRWMTWINHNISRDIIRGFDGEKIIMENLKGIRKRNRGRKMNYWISNWSFFQLQFFIQYKAERVGMTFEKVKPNYTSQICHRCGHLGSRSRGMFSCSHCNLSNFNSDLNAGRNLAHPKLGERQAAVTQPHIRCDDVEGTRKSAHDAEHMDKSLAF